MTLQERKVHLEKILLSMEQSYQQTMGQLKLVDELIVEENKEKKNKEKEAEK